MKKYKVIFKNKTNGLHYQCFCQGTCGAYAIESMCKLNNLNEEDLEIIKMVEVL